MNVLWIREKAMRTESFMGVGEVAAHLGIHPETLRRWERSGLIEPAIRRRGRRIYRDAVGDNATPQQLRKMLYR